MVEFAAEVVGLPLDPWERFAAIHAGELLPDGRPRFRRVLLIVSRQSGKTHLLVVLTLYWQFLERQRLILGTSTNLTYAKESWSKAIDIAESVPDLAELMPKDAVRKAAGEECLSTIDGCRYRIAASNRRGGRSLTVNRLVADEVREHDSWDAYNAAYPAMDAVDDAQAFFITNMGDTRSVVLNSLRSDALRFISGGEGDARLGLLEWSAPPGADPEDPVAIAAAKPNLGRRGRDLADIQAEARLAKAAGGEQLAGFLTEHLCVFVPMLDAAIDPERWAACGDPDVEPLETWRDRVALAVDVSLDQRHASLVGAAEVDGVIHLETIAAWEGDTCTADLRRELPGLVRKVKPRVFGFLPTGPAASVAAALADPKKRGKGRSSWPPPGVQVMEVRTDLVQITMGFSDLVFAGQVVHPRDEMLTAHVQAARKKWVADGWTYTRKDSGPIDGAYASATAAHLARTLPPSVGRPRLIVSTST